MSYVALVVGVGTAAYSIISGVSKNNKAKKMARANKRPNYEIPKAVLDNQRILESRAGRGLSQDAISLYKQQSDRQTTSTLDALLKGGGNVNNIGDLYTAVNDGVTRMALIDDEMRSRNIKMLIDQNNILGANQDKAWQVNYWGPYADKAQAAALLKQEGSQQINSGVNTLASAVGSYAMGGMYKKEGNSVFGSASTGAAGSGVNEGFSGRRGFDSTNMGDSTEPRVVRSRLVGNEISAAEKVKRKYPGLSGGRRGGMSSLDPVWNEDLGAYVNPLTNEPEFNY